MELISVFLSSVSQHLSLIHICPRLDTLMLAAPVSFAGRLEQYVGRLSREYDGKKRLIVYDYIDSHIPVFDGMYQKRLKTYKKIGFQVISNPAIEKQEVNAIYDSGSYTDVFERDLVEADREILISSPSLISEDVYKRQGSVAGEGTSSTGDGTASV